MSCSPQAPRAAVRYLNLVGDRYLELVDGPERIDPGDLRTAHRFRRTAPNRRSTSTCCSAASSR